MGIRSRYHTRQREMLIGYLREAEGMHVTAGDACDYFRAHDMPIGQSTVYRHLESLVDEGIVTKYVIDGSTPACFEYMAPESHGSGVGSCYHLKCERCGTLIHLHCEEVGQVADHLFAKHGFKVDPMRTVIFGLCTACQAETDA